MPRQGAVVRYSGGRDTLHWVKKTMVENIHYICWHTDALPVCWGNVCWAWKVEWKVKGWGWRIPQRGSFIYWGCDKCWNVILLIEYHGLNHKNLLLKMTDMIFPCFNCVASMIFRDLSFVVWENYVDNFPWIMLRISLECCWEILLDDIENFSWMMFRIL